MKHCRILFLIAFLSLCGSPPAFSQGFLNKLSKKVEKVNKGLSKVLDTVKEKPQPVSESQSSSSQTSAPLSNTRQNKTPFRPLKAEEPAALTAVSPYVDKRTIFIHLPASDFPETLMASDVVEGIFCVQGKNGMKVFYDIETGRRIATVQGAGIGHDYKSTYTDYVNENNQTFSGGFLAMELSRALPSGEKYVTVTSEGKVYILPKTYRDVTRMLDGMALAHVGYSYDVAALNPYGGDVNPALNGLIKGDLVMRYLRDNRRAVLMDRKWGFVDSQGKVIVPGRYDQVSDFSCGVAWVQVENRLGLIDTSGKELLAPSIAARSGAVSIFQRQIMSEFSPEGICRYMPEERTTVYYDRNGRELKRYNRAEGTPFVDGHAWISYMNGLEKGEDGRIEIIDKDFKVVATLDNSRGDYSTSSVQPAFRPGLGVAKNRDHEFVDLFGRTVIKCNPEIHNTSRNFSADGYAWTRYHRPEWFGGYMRTDGSLAVVLVRDASAVSKIWELLPPPGGGPVGDPPPPPQPEPPLQGDPPHEPPKTKQLFKVGVKVIPAEAATVKGAGEYSYNSEVAVSGTLAEGWTLGSVESSARLKATDREFVYRVEGSGTITVYCVRKPDVTPTADMALEGTLPFINNISVPVYLETSATAGYASEYGKTTSGVFAVMLDPTTPYENTSDGEKKMTLSVRLFCPPMKVEGVTEENSKKYLVVSGVTAMAGDASIAGVGSLSAMAGGMWFNLLTAVNGFDNLVCMPRTYRVEMNEIDPNTKEFTLGALEVWSGKYGWLPGGDRRVHEVRNGFLASAGDGGWGANDFKGVRMKTVEKRKNLLWSPPADFFSRPPTDFSKKVYGTPTDYHGIQRTHTLTFGPK